MTTENEQEDQYKSVETASINNHTTIWTLSKKETISTGINPPSLSIEECPPQKRAK